MRLTYVNQILAVSSILAAAPASAAVVTVELCAKPGTVTMTDGVAVPIWGYALRPASVPCSDPSVVARLPGPVIEAKVGDELVVTLTNGLSEPTSIVFPGQRLYPDLTGVAPGGSSTYAFTAQTAGTFRYEAGANAPLQVPMGLYGALVVRPTTAGRAYAGAATAYDREVVLVLSEVDAAVNAAPSPTTLMRYRPRYWLINGTSYPAAAAIAALPGERVLLRYVNAGETHLTMSALGAHQTFVAGDAFELRYPAEQISQTIAAGQTADAIIDLPDGVGGLRIPIYARQLQAMATGAASSPAHFPGGMLTFIEVGSLSPASVHAAPPASVSERGPVATVAGSRGCSAASSSPGWLAMLAVAAFVARRSGRRAAARAGRRLLSPLLLTALALLAPSGCRAVPAVDDARPALTTPERVSVTAIDAERAEVTWSAVPTATGYRVLAQRDGRGRGLLVKAEVEAPATSAVVRLDPRASHRLWVAAYSASGEAASISGAPPARVDMRGASPALP